MFEHGGNIYEAAQIAGCDINEIIDLSSNVLHFIPEGINRVLNAKGTESSSRLPEPYSKSFIELAADYYRVSEEHLVAAAGTTELIERICRMFEGKTAGIIQPTYNEYEKYCKLNNITVKDINFTEEDGFCFHEDEVISAAGECDVVFICNPNNPTGTMIDFDEIRFIADMFKKTIFVIDESYMPFVDGRKETALGCHKDNLICLRSYSKIYGIPGLRFGFMFTVNKQIVQIMRNQISPWAVSSPAQLAAEAALMNVDRAEIAEEIRDLREKTFDMLLKFEGIKIFWSHANFLLLKIEGFKNGELFNKFLSKKILIRDCSNFKGLDETFIRVSMRNPEHVGKFLKVLKEILAGDI